VQRDACPFLERELAAVDGGLAGEHAEERGLAGAVRPGQGDAVAPLDAVEWVRVPLFVVNRREGRVRDHSAEVESLLDAAGIPYEREAAAVLVRATA
jgi:hypothetical protein